MDDIIQKAHLGRVVAGLLEGVQTALGGGAGTGSLGAVVRTE
jgi:hypothetical protein